MAKAVPKGNSKKSAPGGDSYYTVIRGKKYDRRMLELAEGLTSGRGDGRISINDAKNLLRVVKDANNYSPTEKATMEYIRKHFKFTKEGDEFFRGEIRRWAASKGKKKSSAKEKKGGSENTAPAAAMATPAAPAHASTTTQTSGAESKPQGSAFKTIFIALVLLAAIAAAFYFLVYKSSCAKPRSEVTETAPTAVTPAPAAPVTAPPAAPTAMTPAQTAPKPAEVAADVRAYVEKARVLFIAEKTALSPASENALDELAAKLKGSSAKLQITGHTCSLGPKELNQKISEKRANVVKDALVARGVPAAQIETRGVGDTQPVGDNKTVAGRVANRRVVFKLLN